MRDCVAVTTAVHTTHPQHVCVPGSQHQDPLPHIQHGNLTFHTGARAARINLHSFMQAIAPNDTARICKTFQSIFKRGIICI